MSEPLFESVGGRRNTFFAFASISFFIVFPQLFFFPTARQALTSKLIGFFLSLFALGPLRKQFHPDSIFPFFPLIFRVQTRLEEIGLRGPFFAPFSPNPKSAQNSFGGLFSLKALPPAVLSCMHINNTCI